MAPEAPLMEANRKGRANFGCSAASYSCVQTDFTIEVTGGRTWARIAVSGELDLCTSPDLRAALEHEHARNRPTVVDLSGVTFMDSTGLVTILRAMGDAQENHWQLGIATPLGAAVTRTASLCGVLARLPLVED